MSNEEEFEEYFSGMICEFELENESWFDQLYSLKEKWSPALSKPFFSAGILSTQRSESTNNAISFRANKNTSLTQFFRLFDVVINRWRSNEKHKEHKNTHNRPRLNSNNALVKHAAEVYLKLYIP